MPSHQLWFKYERNTKMFAKAPDTYEFSILLIEMHHWKLEPHKQQQTATTTPHLDGRYTPDKY